MDLCVHSYIIFILSIWFKIWQATLETLRPASKRVNHLSQFLPKSSCILLIRLVFVQQCSKDGLLEPNTLGIGYLSQFLYWLRDFALHLLVVLEGVDTLKFTDKHSHMSIIDVIFESWMHLSHSTNELDWLSRTKQDKLVTVKTSFDPVFNDSLCKLLWEFVLSIGCVVKMHEETVDACQVTTWASLERNLSFKIFHNPIHQLWVLLHVQTFYAGQ